LFVEVEVWFCLGLLGLKLELYGGCTGVA